MNKEQKEMKIIEKTKEDISFDVRPSTVFYEEWYKTIKDFPQKERDKAYKYLFEYAFYGIEPKVKDKTSPSYVAFRMAKPNVDSAQKRYDAATENGQKGGRPPKVTELVKTNILELRKKGLTQKQVATELGLSLKTIQRVEKDISQNHNENVNDNVNVNVNVNNVASNEDNIKTESSTPTPQTPTELTWEEYNSVMDIWENSTGTGKKPNDIADELKLDRSLVNKAIDDFKKNGFTRKRKHKSEHNRIIGRDNLPTCYYTDDFNITKENISEKYKELTNPFGYYKFQVEYVDKWFLEAYGYVHKKAV